MKNLSLLLFLILAPLANGQTSLETVDYVDVNRYLGRWYDIASFPQWFQEGCTNTQAVYELKKNGDLKVTNSCNKDTTTGKLKVSVGKAKIVDQQTNSKLKVSFFGPFYGNYWIIDLGENYEYAVVSDPTKETLWILSRTIKLEKSVLDGILARLKTKGFDISKLNFTIHQ